MFDLPRNRVFTVDAIDLRVDEQPHPLEVRAGAEIAANWSVEIEARPKLFDGRVVLLSSLVLDGNVLRGVVHEVAYSTFLYWRRHRCPDAEHIYAHAVPVCSDGALLAIRMSAGTVNEGRIYFAAGSFEPADFRDGRVDPGANMAREVAEETGLSLSGLRCDRRYHVLSLPTGTSIGQRYYLPDDGAAILQQVSAFIAGEDDPEADMAVLLRAEAGRPGLLAPHMNVLLDWHFADA